MENDEKNIDLWISSPQVTENQMQLLAMFYQATEMNKIGLAQVMNLETGKQELVLAGVEFNEGEVQYYPLAVVLDASQAAMYVPLQASEDITEEVNE